MSFFRFFIPAPSDDNTDSMDKVVSYFDCTRDLDTNSRSVKTGENKECPNTLCVEEHELLSLLRKLKTT